MSPLRYIVSFINRIGHGCELNISGSIKIASLLSVMIENLHHSRPGKACHFNGVDPCSAKMENLYHLPKPH